MVDLSRVTKRRARSLIFQVWAVIEMQCKESTIYIYLQFKRQYFLQTIESARYLKIQARKTDALHFSHHSHVLIRLYVLCSDWSKFARWVQAENLYCILKLVYFDRWSYKKVLFQLVVFLTVFPLYVQNEKQLSRVFCYSWLFWLRNELLVKVGNPISDDIFFVFHLAGFVGGLKSFKWFWSHLIAFRSCI